LFAMFKRTRKAEKMKELKDYIHLYIGCNVIDEHNFIMKLVGVTASEVEDGKTIAICDIIDNSKTTGPFQELYVEEVKLVLRPLESMTESEMYEYTKMASPAREGKNILPVIKAGPLINHFLNKHDPVIIKWLLGKSFDLFGLIPAGLAVDKTKTEI